LNIKTPSSLTFGGLKIAALVAGLALYVLYDYLPVKNLDLTTFAANSQVVMLDKQVGGDTEFRWIDREQNRWVCEVRGGIQYPFCSMTLIIGESREIPYYDLSGYTDIKMDVEYTGPSNYLRVFIRNEYDVGSNDGIEIHIQDDGTPVKNGLSFESIQKAKFNSVKVPIEKLTTKVSIPLTEFRVPDWWIEGYAISPQDNKPDLSKAFGIGIDISNPFKLGMHEFQIKRITAVGAYISKETMYLLIVMLFGLIFVVELVLQLIKLKSSVKQSSMELNQLGQENRRFKRLAHVDPLSHALNRNGLEQVIDDLVAENRLDKYAILLIDIDNFKVINDQFGHIAGDSIITQISTLLKRALRADDVVCRWGGEEFVVLFSCLESKNASDLAEKLCLEVASHNFNLEHQHQVTVSGGVVLLSSHPDFHHAFKRADELLYQAKSSGKNKVLSDTNEPTVLNEANVAETQASKADGSETKQTRTQQSKTHQSKTQEPVIKSPAKQLGM